ncbi:hypothetical protein ABIA39_007128 [Nocardia sp. GAS34]
MAVSRRDCGEPVHVEVRCAHSISRDSLVPFGPSGVHWSVVADQNRG